MATEADATFQYSGGSGNTNPLLSLGGAPSGTTVPPTIENIFGNISATQVINGFTDYRMVYLLNDGNAALNSLTTFLKNQLDTPAQISLGYFLVNDLQRFTFNAYPSGGNIQFTYTDIFLNKYVLAPITYTTPVALATTLQTQLNSITDIVGQDVLGGVECATTILPVGFILDISYKGASGNKYQYLLTQTNTLGVAVTSVKAIDGSPINTEPDFTGNPTVAPNNVIFTSATSPQVIGTLLNNAREPGEGEYLPIWIRRVVPAGTQAQEVAGATLAVSGLVYPPLPTPTTTATPTPTATGVPSPTPSGTTTPTPTSTPTATMSPTPSGTEPTATPTPSPNGSATATPTPSATVTSTPTPTATSTPSPTPTATFTAGQLYIWGRADSGALGNNTVTPFKNSPIRIAPEYTWNEFRFGVYSFEGAITNNGLLATWGNNGSGNLGLGDIANRSVPTFMPNSSGILWSTSGCALACGSQNMAAVKSNGTLWSWGKNNYGQLATNNTISRSSPVQVGVSSNWYSVTLGWDCGLAINTAAQLYGFGSNYYGQLANNSTVNRSAPTQILPPSGASWALNTPLYTKMAMAYNTMAIDTLGRLWGWGLNSWGSLGNNEGFVSYSSPILIGTDYVAVSVGRFHTLALKTDNSLWAWGYNGYGELGQNDRIARSSPVQIPGSWRYIAAGAQSSYAIKTGGIAYSWGRGDLCALGDSACFNRSSPSLVSTSIFGWTKIGAGYYDAGLS